MDIDRVLIVDDEEHIRLVSRLSAEKVGGWEVLLASSGMEALEIASRERLDLILLDVMMPDLDGPGTLKLLREQPATKDIPVIFLAAKVQRHEVQGYLELGASGVISKPFDPMRLPEDVRKIVSGI